MSVINVTTENFEKAVKTPNKTVLVDFWAAWCGPCRMIAPVLEEIAKERQDVMVLKVNVDQEQDIAAKYDVQSIPTLIVFKNGKPINKQVGFRGKEHILALLK